MTELERLTKLRDEAKQALRDAEKVRLDHIDSLKAEKCNAEEECTEQRIMRAVLLRGKNMTFKQIGNEFGVSASQARSLYKQGVMVYAKLHARIERESTLALCALVDQQFGS